MKKIGAGLVAVTLALGASVRGEDKKDPAKDAERAVAVDRAMERGIAALASAQAADGHFAQDYPIAITAMAGLAILAAKEKPLEDPTLLKAYAWLDKQQKEGNWPQENYTWVHSQGFATLFFAEVYGKIVMGAKAPDGISKEALRATVSKAVNLLADAQSKSGGWWYTKSAGQDEGSTTVCAVQAIRAAKNFGILVEPHVLERGFAYLKAMQNQDGGFRYQGTAGGSMRAGTAAAVATLVLMSKLDERVLLSGVEFLDKFKVEGLAREGQAAYGLFYSAMAMKVIAEEYGDHIPAAPRWTRALEDHFVSKQAQTGLWSEGDPAYGTSLAVLALACPKGRLSVFNRRAPKLPS